MISIYEGNEPYIFISYSHKDSNIVLPIVNALSDRGYRVWYDAGIEAGTEWPEYIAEHLVSCGCFIAFLSNNSLSSKNCTREINFAISENKSVLAVYVEECKLSAGMKMQLGSVQALYAYRHPNNDSLIEELAKARIVVDCMGNCNKAGENTDELLEKAIVLYNNEEYDEAFSIYFEIAKQGNATAQFNVGFCFENGSGVEENPNKAFEWYMKAAEQGHATAQFNVGFCFEYGKGVNKNVNQAIIWYKKAAAQGDTDAIDCLKRLGITDYN